MTKNKFDICKCLGYQSLRWQESSVSILSKPTMKPKKYVMETVDAKTA